MVRLQSWSLGNKKLPFITINPLVNSDPGAVIPMRIPSMRQIELFSVLQGIIIGYLKPYNIRIRQEYLIKRITNVK